jgi:hypothetical protein
LEGSPALGGPKIWPLEMPMRNFNENTITAAVLYFKPAPGLE